MNRHFGMDAEIQAKDGKRQTPLHRLDSHPEISTFALQVIKKSVIGKMHPFHIVVSIINLLCGVSAFASILLVNANLLVSSAQSILAFAVFFGYFANGFAIYITFILVIILTIHALNKTAKQFISDHWLGFTNGSAVILFWVLVFVFSDLCKPIQALILPRLT